MFNKFIEFLKRSFKEARFNIIRVVWHPNSILHNNINIIEAIRNYIASTVIHYLFKPTDTINIDGKNSNKNLNDITLENDLPFLLAQHNKITELDFSNNTLGAQTIEKIGEHIQIYSNGIKEINLSNNPLDENAQKALTTLISSLLVRHTKITSLNLNNCNLTKENIDLLIDALKKNSWLTNLSVEGNADLTAEQQQSIKELLDRNTYCNKIENEYHKKDILDFQNTIVEPIIVKNLAFYITDREFHTNKNVIKEIKLPIKNNTIDDAGFEPLVQALKKNSTISNLTMDYRRLNSEIVEAIRLQLMINQAINKLVYKPTAFRNNLLTTKRLLGYISIGSASAHILRALSIFNIAPIALGVMAAHFIFNDEPILSRNKTQLRKTKTADYTTPENIAAITRGKNAAHYWTDYLNPKAYTPMAYLGYTIEKEKLAIKHSVTTACFQPVVTQHKL